MIKHQLLRYQMNKEEEKIWAQLCNAIKYKFRLMKLTPLAYEILEKRLQPKEPFYGSKGYSCAHGYYNISEGDRGECSIVFLTKSRDDAENKMIKKLAHNIGYECILKENEKIEQQNRNDWHFYNVIDGFTGGRVISHDVENATWKYDTKYDYRKYWFEMTLYILKGTAPLQIFQEEIGRYEELMNFHFDSPFWKFDVDRMEFVCV